MAGLLFQKFLGLALLPAPASYCQHSFSSPCFTAEQLSSLNSSIGGRLSIPSTPNFVNCTNAACFDPLARISTSSVQYLNFESGIGLGGGPNGTDEAQARGRTPDYVVDAQVWSDVVEGVTFAAQHHLRLRMKNTGHDYLGRSSDVGSFTIWTHHLKGTTFDPLFVPAGAPADHVGVPALVAAAGTSVHEVYAAADAAGVIAAAGTSGTVGAAGGWVAGGGHGPLGPLVGMGVDNVLQFTSVLANGSIVTSSPFSHSRLFKSLCGGGGSYAVNLEVVFRAHAPPAGFVGAFGNFQVNADAENKTQVWQEFNREWMKAQPSLSAAGFAGYTYLRTPLPSPFAYVLPSSDLAAAKLAWAPFVEYINAQPDMTFKIDWVPSPTWYPLWSGPFTAALDSLDEVGINLLLGGRLIPRAVVEDELRRDALADFFAAAASPSIVHLVAGGAVEKSSGEFTSINPLWRKTLLHVDLPASWPVGTPLAQIKGIEAYVTSHTLALGKLAEFEGGAQACYPSEADYNEAAWQETWYGEAYPELLATKKIYDPKGVFTARRAVGSELVGW